MTTQKRRRFTPKSPKMRAFQIGGWTLLGLGLFQLGRIPYFYWHNNATSHHLLRHATRPATQGSATAASTSWPKGLIAIMKIPALHVTAPILQGTHMAQLNVAVGHLPQSVMPGTPGTSILAGHNATWFHHINQLKNGATIRVESQHTTWTFTVHKKSVVHTGSPIYNSASPSIVLEACYPLNVLYLTPYRYLVWAKLSHTSTHAHNRAGQALSPTVFTPEHIPAAVKSQGVTLKTNAMPMGHLAVSGAPTKGWRQSNAPLNAADATTSLYFAALHIAQDNSRRWWHKLARHVPYSAIAPLTQGAHVRYITQANESETVQGTHVQKTTLVVKVNIAGGPHPGVYTIRSTTRVAGHRVTLVGWQMT